MSARSAPGKGLARVVLVAVLLGAACGNKATTGAPSAGPTAGGPATSSATVSQGAGGFVFSPSTLTVKRGDTITVQNVGNRAHTFTIDATSIDVLNGPGKSDTVTIDLPSGTYRFYCRYFLALGMKGTLTVEP